MENNRETNNWYELLESGISQGGFSTEDLVAIFVPILKKLLLLHEEGNVLPAIDDETLFEIDGILDFDKDSCQPIQRNSKAIDKISSGNLNAFEVTKEDEMVTNLDDESIKVINNKILEDENNEINTPVYLKDYKSYEIILGHHDELTDIFQIGLVFASFALNLSLKSIEDLSEFVNNRDALSKLNPRINPVISNLINEMTELDRTKRARDLYQIIEKLEKYKEIEANFELDFSQIEGFEKQDLLSRTDKILSKLKSRLFDFTRRNKLLFYSNNMRFLNLTVSSVPSVLDYNRIKAEDLFIWNNDISKHVSSGKEILLNKYLRIDDNPYIIPTLDRIRSENVKDKNEFGISQLRLVLAFFRWNNLKENLHERINTPLLLLPVEIVKKKGLKDQYTLEVLSTSAEVNPVLVHLLNELYGFKLPDYINLEQTTVEEFYKSIEKQISSSNTGVKLQYQDKPRIQMIHSIAKQTLAQFRKKLKKFEDRIATFRNIKHSYTKDNFVPFGLEIFKKRVQPKLSSVEFIVGGDVKLNSYSFAGNNGEISKNLFTLVDAEKQNDPYKWEFDVCNIVLGNFNYKKMSLVRDYNSAIDNHILSPILEDLFSTEPKIISQKEEEIPLSEQYNIVNADPTQIRAVAKSHFEKSYIIQGPPGTGKSQTITNLIADFVARGKKVLFVCEKRAAIDVVYFRLKQKNLDQLCARIHDSQADKKEFIQDLKSCYEKVMRDNLQFEQIEEKRDEIVDKIETELSVIRRFNQSMKHIDENIGIPLRKLYERLLELKSSHVDFTDLDLEKMPQYKYWLEYNSIIKELSDVLKSLGEDNRFAIHPISNIKKEVLLSDNPLNNINEYLKIIEDSIFDIHNRLSALGVPQNLFATYKDFNIFMENFSSISFLSMNGLLSLLEKSSLASVEFEKKCNEFQNIKKDYEEILQRNLYWTKKLSRTDLATAFEIYSKSNSILHSIFNSRLAQLKKTLNDSYDFAKHSVRPEMITILNNLDLEYKKLDELNQFKEREEISYKTENILELKQKIEEFLAKEKEKEFQDDIQYIKTNISNIGLLTGLAEIYEIHKKIAPILSQLFEEYNHKSLINLNTDIDNLRQSLAALPELLPTMTDLLKSPDDLQYVIKKYPLNPEQIENTFAYKSLKEKYRYDRQLNLVEGSTLKVRIKRIKELYSELQEINSDYVRAKVQENFIKNLNLSSQSAATLNIKDSEFKRNYSEGRKILEHEFTKTMRYKPIRELASRESGRVIQDLKPVWLMSPLSVSDTLPMDINFFDVVIFDEASQITIEEGIPPIYRGKYTIIVGDQMQMPPTNFFASKSVDPDDLDNFDDDVDTEITSLDAESLLVQASRKLDSVLLGWHYRSQYESLINFSNSAFYSGNLLTIPDRSIQNKSLEEITISQIEQAEDFAKEVLKRSISFHFMESGIYTKRSNLFEAEYIANLVKVLLKNKIKESIGIVAFSQEQQIEIENALSKLAQKDESFKELLEANYEKVENDQFVGLFVKNLENVQGDERDIVILSICYGFDGNGKMLMNFGPINRQGGEKRLNVIFSRAKKHMVVVSSIRHFNIKNEYNEGANYFRKFLEYAESISKGNFELANLILNSMSIKVKGNDLIEDVVVTQLMNKLEEAGYTCKKNIGQSYFKCNIGIVNKHNPTEYLLGIMVDNAFHYNTEDVMEQYFMKPELLKNFGWNVMQIFAKDWYHNPDKVFDKILKILENRGDEEIIEEQNQIENTKVENSNIIENSISTETEMVKNEKWAESESIGENLKKVESEQMGENREENINEEMVQIEPENSNSRDIPIVINQNPLSLNYERYELVDGTHNKFWEVAVDNLTMYVKYGRIGTSGQMNLKIFQTNEEAVSYSVKMKREKIQKGYKLIQ